MLDMTRRNATSAGVQDRIWLHHADVHALPFLPEAFDAVVAIGVVPWLHSESLALQEMHRVLKRGGHLLVTADNNVRLNRILDPLSCPLLSPMRSAAKRLLQPWGLWSSESGFQPKRHRPAELDRLTRDSGFRCVNSCTVGFGPFTFFRKELFTDALGVEVHRRLQPIAFRKRLSPLRWAGSHYMVLAAKS
jgi:ubiquinone/menaquinone biosynthesis C-methylase UbiE